jgi:16S rRNA (adenine1518-N6/adenine1519-N6)-dimethyltransferase
MNGELVFDKVFDKVCTDMTLSEIKQVLTERGIRLTKSLGQNFLHDANQVRRIVSAAHLERSDRVLEIGPGLGALTSQLLQQSSEVLAIEKDSRLVKALQERFKVGQASRLPLSQTSSHSAPGGTEALHLVHADALTFLQESPNDWTAWKFVSNLPYSVASPILVELAQSPCPPKCIVATVQLEVARRLMARTGDKDYGILTLLVQLAYEPVGSTKVPAPCFFPQPDVDSACVSFARRSQSLLSSDEGATFRKIVKCAFSQRRKMMLKLLKQHWPEELLLGLFSRLELPQSIRAEEVTVSQFCELSRGLGRAGTTTKD